MLEIPTFVSQQGYGSGVPQGGTIPIATGAAEGNALAEGMNRVATHFANVHAQMQRQADAVEASKASGEAEMAAAELSQKYANDPDPSTAPQRFRQELTQQHQQALAGIQNPRVKQIVMERLSRTGPVAYIHMLQQSAAGQRDIAQASGLAEIDRQSKALAASPDGATADLAVQGIISTAGGMEGTGAVRRGAGRLITSKGIAEAVTALGMTDPVAAQALAKKYEGHIDLSHRLEIERSLRVPLLHREGDAAAMRKLGTTGAGDMPPDFDGQWQRIERMESGGRQMGADGQPLTSSAGAIGVAQVMPGTARAVATSLGETLDENRYRTDEAYNRRLGQTYYKQMLDQFGHPALAAAAYNAGPKRVEQWIAQNGDPRTGQISMAEWAAKIPIAETRNYVQKFGTGDPARAPNAPRTMAQIQQGRDELITELSGKPEVLDRALSTYNRQVHRQEAQFKAEQDDIKRHVEDYNRALLNGVDDGSITPERINASFPEPIARGMNQRLEISRQAGQIYKGVEFASPAGVAAERARLVAERGGGAPGSSENQVHRDAVLTQFDHQMAERARKLKADPKAYVDNSPVVLARRAMLGQGGPNAWQDYVSASLSEQERLGVPASERRVMSDAEAKAMVTEITKAPPEKVDMERVIGQLQTQYGRYWQSAYDQLVSEHLPRTYMVVGSMDQAKQAPHRAALQRGLTMLAQPKGMQGIHEAAGKHNIGPTDAAVDAQLAEFKQTAVHNQGGLRLIADMVEASQLLAYTYVIGGKSPQEAAQMAVQGILYEKYDFDRTMRVPKGELAAMQSATRQVQRSITADMLIPPPIDFATQGTTEEARLASYVANARNGEWVPNANDTGLVLMERKFNGALVAIHGINGPIQVMFGTGGTFGAVSGAYGNAASSPAPAMTAPSQMRTFD